MTLIQLRYFLTIAEQGSFTGAARLCHVSQPSLSTQIAALEEEAGERLFVRSKRGVVLTPSGNELLSRARGVLESFESLERSLHGGLAAEPASIRVGAIPTIAPYLLPAASAAMLKAYPSAQLEIREDLTNNLLQSLRRREIDLAVLSTFEPRRGIDFEVLDDDDFIALVPRSLALRGGSIGVEQLRRHPFILLQDTHCLGVQLAEFCQSKSLITNVVCHAAQIVTIQQFVGAGIGVSVLPRLSRRLTNNDKVSFVPMRGVNARRPIVVAWRAEFPPEGAGARFVDIIRQELTTG